MKTISISAILVPFLNIESLIHKTDKFFKKVSCNLFSMINSCLCCSKFIFLMLCKNMTVEKLI